MNTMKQQTNRAALICLGIAMACFAALALTGCGTGPQGDPGAQGAQGLQGATGTPGANFTPPAETDVQTLVDDENAWRQLSGATQLSAGLSCTVQALGSGQWLSSSSPGYQSSQGVVTALAGAPSYAYLFTSAFDQPDTASGPNGLLPTAIQPLFVGNNYKINCTGQIVVSTSGYYAFDLNSDDGSILTIDGSQVVNNDGNHSITDKSGTKLLRRGVHTFSLAYAQSGGGNFGLILQANGSPVPGTVWYH